MLERFAKEKYQSVPQLAFLKGFEAHQKGNFEESEAWYGIAATEGDINSLLLLGARNNLFRDDAADSHSSHIHSDEYLEYLKKAAKKGSPSALFHLANAYHLGIGVKKDTTEAKTWYKTAIENHNHLPSILSLGDLVRDEGDLQSALVLYEQAATQGSKEAAKVLGLAYFFGNGVSQDFVKSEEYFRIAEENFYLGWLALQKLPAPLVKEVEEDNQTPEEKQRRMAKHRDYIVQAYEATEALANEGNPDAQKKIGDFYYDGIWTDKNPAEARKWYLQAAEQGSPGARFYLREMELSEMDITNEEQVKDVISEIEDLAARGVPDAKEFLAYHKMKGGMGIKKNVPEAFKLYKELADEEESPGAAYQAGLILCRGKDVRFNPEDAARYMGIAAKAGHPEATRKLASMHYLGFCVKKDEEEAIRVLMRCLSLSKASAYYALAMVVKEFKGSKKDTAAVKRLLTVAAEEGDAISNYMLGTMAEDADDLEQAIAFYRKAADLGLAGGYYSLFLLYFQEKLPQDDEKAREYLHKAVEGNDLQACLHLASLIYDSAPGYSGDLAMVERLLLKAADGGHPEAMKQLGEMYYYGFNFPHEPEKGIAYLEKAMVAGNEEASKVLTEIHKQKEEAEGSPKPTKPRRKRKSERTSE